MNTSRIYDPGRRLTEGVLLSPDFFRALRSAVAFIIPLIIFNRRGESNIGAFAATASLNIALTIMRGDYFLRLAVLLTMSVVMAASVLLGAVVGRDTIAATLAMGGLALLGGIWRHLSADYGPRLGVVSALLFLMALALPGGAADGWRVAEFTLLGALGGTALQLAAWFVRPQHALRHAVAESWVAVSDLFAMMRPEENPGGDFAERERELRASLDETAKLLASAASKQRAGFLQHLEDLRYKGAQLATRVSALNTVLETLKARPEYTRLAPALDSVLRAHANAARSVALTLIMHRPEQFTATEVRLQRCAHLIRILDGHLAALGTEDAGLTQARRVLDQIQTLLPMIGSILRETVDHGTGIAGFPLRLTDLTGIPLRSLSAWINPADKADEVLVRYSLRMAVVTMFAVAVYKAFVIPRGYWVAFTAIVVLQPDYGSTRERAVQRIAGTVAGGLVGSAFLWIHPPLLILEALTTVTAFLFVYFLRRRYGLAVFYVTLMLVVAIETTTPLKLDFTISRSLSNIAGGALALLAAWLFWPSWERDRFPRTMAAAIRANRNYLEAIARQLFRAQPFAGEAVEAKRRAEQAGGSASAALQRILGEPADHQENVRRDAALTAYNQRVTRALTVLALQLNEKFQLDNPELGLVVRHTCEALDELAIAVETEKPAPVARLADDLRRVADFLPGAATVPPAAISLIYNQLAKIAMEIDAMTLAMDTGADKANGA